MSENSIRMAVVPRISVTWIFIAVVALVFLFFGYQIFNATGTITSPKSVHFDPSIHINEMPDPHNSHEEIQIPQSSHYVENQQRDMPYIPGQSDAELRESEPLQQTPPTAVYDVPQAEDALNAVMHSNAEFGDNLRHPEQMIEMQPPLGTSRYVPGGIAGEDTSSGSSTEYSPEFAGNGGEFMSGIYAYDGSDSSSMFASI